MAQPVNVTTHDETRGAGLMRAAPSLALILAISLPLFGAASAEAAEPTAGSSYHWPLDHPRRVSSTFGEYRQGHFHAGVDLSTSGREGIPVMAVDDGEVVRVRASGIGYGRAIYIQLRNGKLAVYAHLSAYMEPLAEYVEAVQDSLGRYRVDLYPERGRFPVTRGQVIGRSGSSGAGGAHFHFELREGDIAVNPLLHGFAAADASAPLLQTLVLTPLDGTARINGSSRKMRIPLRKNQSGELAAIQDVTISGRVGVGVRGFDLDGDVGNRLGIYRTELFVDGERRFVARFDRFDYLRNHEVEAEYDFEEARAGRRTVRNLFVPPGVTGDFHDGLAAWSGILEGMMAETTVAAPGPAVRLAPGGHDLRIVAADAFGNVTTASAVIRVKAEKALVHDQVTESPLLAGTGLPLAGGVPQAPKVHLDPGARVATLTLDFARAPARSPVLLAPGAGRPIPLKATSSVRYVATIDARGETPLQLKIPAPAGGDQVLGLDLPWTAVSRARAGRYATPDGSVRIDYPARAFFEDAYLWVEEQAGAASLPEGLEPVSRVFRMEPADLPLDQGLWVGIRPGPGGVASAAPASEGVALYRIAGGDIDYQGAEVRDGLIGTRVRRLATFVLARDTRPPSVQLLSPTDTVLAASGRPLLRARVRDLESGFAEDSLTFLIDGRRVPSEWNPEASDLRYRTRRPLAPGPHTIVVEATDRAGNTTRRSLNVTVR